jgi:hypothetical protein
MRQRMHHQGKIREENPNKLLIWDYGWLSRCLPAAILGRAKKNHADSAGKTWRKRTTKQAVDEQKRSRKIDKHELAIRCFLKKRGTSGRGTKAAGERIK